MRGSKGAGILAAGVAVACAALAAPAWPASRPPRRARVVTTSVTGPLTIAWSGDPAHGCAAAGLCGVSGTLQLRFGGGQQSTSGSGPVLVQDDASAVARAQTTAPDGTVTTCADVVSAELDFTTTQVGRPVRAGNQPLDGVHLAGAGRCAGPTSADLAHLSLPTRREAHGFDLTGRASTTAGPFLLTGTSGIRIDVRTGTQRPPGFPNGIESGAGGPGKGHSVLAERAAVTYRVTGVTGALTTDFSGLTAPLCEGVGACGAQGQLVQSFTTRGTLTFSGERTVAHAARRLRALADLRDGRMALADTFGGLTIHGTVHETSKQIGGLSCASTTPIVLPRAFSRRSPAGADELGLPGGDPFGGITADPFRTRCPGPSATDVLGDATLAIARASVRARDLGDRHLTITFRARRTFTGAAYAGRRSGTVTVALTLERARGGTHRERVFPGETVIG